MIDSSAWIEYLALTDSGKLGELIEHGSIGTSVLAVAEIADKFEREKRQLDVVLRFIKSRGLVYPVTISGAIMGAKHELSRRQQIPEFGIIDGIHLATAQERKAVFVTMDSDFNGMPGVLFIQK